MVRIKWTKARDLIVIEEIQKNHLNLSAAFRNASERINTTPTSVQGRYYNALRSKYNILTTGSVAGFSDNVKNLKRNKGGNLPEPDLKPVAWVLKEMLNLSKADRNLIIQILK